MSKSSRSRHTAPTPASPAPAPADPPSEPSKAAQADTAAQGPSAGLAYAEFVLPSKGRFYGPHGVFETPELPGGVLAMRKTTLAEEEAMWGAGGAVAARLTKLIRAVCKLPDGFDPAHMLLTDRMFVMIAVRRLCYGSTYDVKFKCEECGHRQKTVVDVVRDLEMKEADESVDEPLQVPLKDAGVTVGIRFRRGIDETELTAVSAQAEKRGRKVNLLQETLQRQLVTLDGAPFENAFAKTDLMSKITATDLASIRIAVDKSEPGIDLTIYPECTRCGEVNEFATPLSDEFFRPSRL